MRLKNVEEILKKSLKMWSLKVQIAHTLKNAEFKIESLEKTYVTFFNLAIHFSKNFSSTLTTAFKVVVGFQKQFSGFSIFFDNFCYDIYENLGEFYI